MSKIFRKRRRSSDPRQWHNESLPLSIFNDSKTLVYTAKLTKLTHYDGDPSSSSTTTTTMPLYYQLFDQHSSSQHQQQQQQQRRPDVKHDRKRFKVEVVLNPKNTDPSKKIRVPYGMSKYLKEHQIEGVRFMWKHIVERKQGCVLAHSMGLGKSIQTVTFVTTLLDVMAKHEHSSSFQLDEFKSKRILLLAPLITLSHWVNEFDKWRPPGCVETSGNIYNYADTPMASASRRLKYLQHWYKDGGILLMSYEQFRISVLRESHDRDLIRTMLVDPGPAILIADEAHRIKNSTSQLTIALQLVKTRARLCLTGSPLQNNLLEFYHVVEFACPNYLPAQQEFNHLYLKPIQNVYADSPASNIYMAKKQLFKLQLLTADIILRRDTTILAKELPKKIEYYVGCKLKELQYKGYESLLHLFKHTDIQENPMINLCVLRAICNHPSVLNQMAVGRQDKVMPVPTISTQRNHELEESDIALEEEMMEISTAIKTTQLMAMAEKLFDTIPDIDDPRHSSKTEVIVGIATACRDANDKLVIVSHSILCLDYLENLLGTLQFQTARIDGSTPATERQPIIETFNNSTTQHIMFLSARAGSLGVNITGANRMILCDSDWNPQHDEQGVGRVYRYGQTKDVFIYRLYTYTTIEHKLLYQSIHKRGIASRVVDNDKLSLQDKHEMRKYYALPQRNPSSNTNRILSKIQDPVLRKVIEENASDVADAVSKETLERDGVQAETELEIADIEKARKEVKGYQQLYYSTKSKRSSGGRDSYSDIL